jgi:hypothetical protein
MTLSECSLMRFEVPCQSQALGVTVEPGSCPVTPHMLLNMLLYLVDGGIRCLRVSLIMTEVASQAGGVSALR